MSCSAEIDTVPVPRKLLLEILQDGIVSMHAFVSLKKLLAQDIPESPSSHAMLCLHQLLAQNTCSWPICTALKEQVHPVSLAKTDHADVKIKSLATNALRENQEPKRPLLASCDLEGVANYIIEHRCRRVVVMCGAGISTSSGVRDFRTAGTGLYDNLEEFDLPSPEKMFDLEFFRSNPTPFYKLAKDMWPGKHHPSPAHYFIKLLSAKGILLRCYSQNIDSLELQTGLPAEQLVAAHGNFDTAHVIDTVPEVSVDINELKEAIQKGEEGWQALRQEKGNLVKPNITFFGESLPKRFSDLAREDFGNCDLLVVLGTSLVVKPFNKLLGMAPPAVPRLLINLDSVGTCDKLAGGFEFQVDDCGSQRDVFHAAHCDMGCRKLVQALGWEGDLASLIDSKGVSSIERAPWMLEKDSAAKKSCAKGCHKPLTRRALPKCDVRRRRVVVKAAKAAYPGLNAGDATVVKAANAPLKRKAAESYEKVNNLSLRWDNCCKRWRIAATLHNGKRVYVGQVTSSNTSKAAIKSARAAAMKMMWQWDRAHSRLFN